MRRKTRDRLVNSRTKLIADDGHQLAAYLAQSTGHAFGVIVVVQEIFGVNRHIRSVADDYASKGFWAVAPALFDRIKPGVELGYTPADATRGMQIANNIAMDAALKDVCGSVRVRTMAVS